MKKPPLKYVGPKAARALPQPCSAKNRIAFNTVSADRLTLPRSRGRAGLWAGGWRSFDVTIN